MSNHSLDGIALLPSGSKVPSDSVIDDANHLAEVAQPSHPGSVVADPGAIIKSKTTKRRKNTALTADGDGVVGSSPPIVADEAVSANKKIKRRRNARTTTSTVAREGKDGSESEAVLTPPLVAAELPGAPKHKDTNKHKNKSQKATPTRQSPRKQAARKRGASPGLVAGDANGASPRSHGSGADEQHNLDYDLSLAAAKSRLEMTKTTGGKSELSLAAKSNGQPPPSPLFDTNEKSSGELSSRAKQLASDFALAQMLPTSESAQSTAPPGQHQPAVNSGVGDADDVSMSGAAGVDYSGYEGAQYNHASGFIDHGIDAVVSALRSVAGASPGLVFYGLDGTVLQDDAAMAHLQSLPPLLPSMMDAATWKRTAQRNACAEKRDKRVAALQQCGLDGQPVIMVGSSADETPDDALLLPDIDPSQQEIKLEPVETEGDLARESSPDVYDDEPGSEVDINQTALMEGKAFPPEVEKRRCETFQHAFPPLFEFTTARAFFKPTKPEALLALRPHQEKDGTQNPDSGTLWFAPWCRHETHRHDPHPFCCACYYVRGYETCRDGCEFCNAVVVACLNLDALAKYQKARNDRMRRLKRPGCNKLECPNVLPPFVIDKDTAQSYQAFMVPKKNKIWEASCPYARRGRLQSRVEDMIENSTSDDPTKPSVIHLSSAQRTARAWLDDAAPPDETPYRKMVLAITWYLFKQHYQALAQGEKLRGALRAAKLLRRHHVTIRELEMSMPGVDLTTLVMPDLPVVVAAAPARTPRKVRAPLARPTVRRSGHKKLSPKAHKKSRGGAGVAHATTLFDETSPAQREYAAFPAQYLVNNDHANLTCVEDGQFREALNLLIPGKANISPRPACWRELNRNPQNSDDDDRPLLYVDLSDYTQGLLEKRRDAAGAEIRRHAAYYLEHGVCVPRPAFTINKHAYHLPWGKAPAQCADYPVTQPAGARAGHYHPDGLVACRDSDLCHTEETSKLVLSQLTMLEAFTARLLDRTAVTLTETEQRLLLRASRTVIGHALQTTVENASHNVIMRRSQLTDAFTPCTTEELVALISGLPMGDVSLAVAATVATPSVDTLPLVGVATAADTPSNTGTL